MLVGDPRGSVWRRWDLHVHTPSSVGDYDFADVTNAWLVEQIKRSGVSAIAITDHHTIDVDRILELQQLGAKELVVFPGIEFRAPIGKEPFHYTALFPSDEDLEDLWEHLSVELGLTPKDVAKRGGPDKLYTEIRNAAPVIRKLGGIVCIHAGGKSNSIEEIPNTHPFFERFKEDIARDCVQLFEVRNAREADDYRRIVFPHIGGEFPIITASDNHDIRDYDGGGCCWIKADCTFAGLRQALTEPQGRIRLEGAPAQISGVDAEPTRYIKSVCISRKDDAKTSNYWFDTALQLNPGLVAVIGRKGSGKSALLDAVGLAGNAHCEDSFSFLSENRFREPNKPLARCYQAEMVLESAHAFRRALDASVNPQAPEQVRYLPQHFLNAVCADPREEAGRRFEAELKDVIFQHLPESDRLGQASLDDLIGLQCEAANARIAQIRRTLHILNQEIVSVEQSMHPAHREELVGLVKQKRRELNAHRRRRLEPVPKPPSKRRSEGTPDQLDQELSAAKVRQYAISFAQERLGKRKDALRRQRASAIALNGKIGNLQAYVASVERELESELVELGIQFSDIVTFQLDKKPLEDLLSLLRRELAHIEHALDEGNPRSLTSQAAETEQRVSELQQKLQEPERKYERYLRDKAEWERRLREIIGSEEKPGSLMWLRAEIGGLREAPDLLEGKRGEREDTARELHRLLSTNASIYEDLYEPVSAFLAKSGQEGGRDPLPLSFSVQIADRGFSETFLRHFINHARKGSFYGIDEGREILSRIVNGVNYGDEEQAIDFVRFVLHHLREDVRTKESTDIAAQLLKDVTLVTLYDYLFGFEYLEPTYSLRWSDKTLDQLSPGEKGALLLVFYLLIDRESKPLLIDQPADNLDNETVFKGLVPYIKEAKNRRQIIIVTHNPNLAVVCDAEQIIRASYSPTRDPFIQYEAGSLENPPIREYAVDALEGTQPAFDKRREKYSASQT